jgi:hypothetical protein
VVCAASRSALYRVTGETLQPLVRSGDTIGDVGPIGSIADGAVGHAFRGGALVVRATDVQGRHVLLLDRGEGLTKLAASGDVSPIGGTFDPSSEATVDVDRRRVVFSSAVLLPDGSQSSGVFSLRFGARAIRALVRPGLSVPGGVPVVDLALVGGTRKPVFRATFADGGSGLFLVRRRRPAVLARSGAPAPGGGVFGAVQEVALDGDRIAFTALLGLADDGPQGVFRVQRGRVQRIAATGDGSPARGPFLGFGAVALMRNDTIFGASIVDAGQPRFGVFRRRRGRIETLALAGDALDGGATLALDTVGRVAVDGVTIGFLGGRSLTNGAPQSALVEIRDGVVGVLAAAGQPTPLGGVYAELGDEAVAPADGALVFASSIDGTASARMGLFAAAHDPGR